MEHLYIQDNQIVEKYLLHQLNDDDTAAFEEHLLICSDCRKELETMERIITQAAKSRMHEVFTGNSGIENKPRKTKPGLIAMYRMAASLLLFIGVSVVLFYFIKRENKPGGQMVNESVSREDSLQQPSPDSIVTEHKVKHISNYLAAEDQAFKPSSFYEPLVSNVYRSADMNISDPAINYSKGVIVFNWSYYRADSLLVLLINNKDSVIFKQRAIPPYKCRKMLKPGLYYWQLQTDDELLFTGKLVIRADK